MTPIRSALEEYEAYQTRHNKKHYARATTYRVKEFLDTCVKSGVDYVEAISEKHIRDYLKLTPKRQFPGAWRSRYTALKTFFNYMVFIEMLNPKNNPMRGTPSADSFTNKHTLTPTDLQRLLLAIPKDHTGMQDQLCCKLLWHGYSLKRINELTAKDVAKFPEAVRDIAEELIDNRGHIKTPPLLVNAQGEPQHLYGQKFNRRLQKYAKIAGLPDAERVTSSLLYQSGTYERFS